MKTALLVAQIVVALCITVSVLLQAQGSGLGSTWGGGGETYHTRRGLEKVLFYFTIVASILFAAISLAIVTV
jgi:preprotein translocase subunit SecG